jgi:ubiquinone/menaquinone biosynthesis C-methylase UbiE
LLPSRNAVRSQPSCVIEILTAGFSAGQATFLFWVASVCFYSCMFRKNMNINNPEKRLARFWGKVDQKHINSFVPFLVGENILDLGCGNGTTTSTICQLGYRCTGIDYDKTSINYCLSKYPGARFQHANVEDLPFKDNYFDTIILRDALHHFYREADFAKVKSEILRVASRSARVIFFDPNINFILKSMRKLTSHKDAECNYETARKIMNEMSLEIIHSEFNTPFSLPLSGGYVGLNFVPNIEQLQNTLLRIENGLELIINKARLGRHLCWRYLLVGQRKTATKPTALGI